MSIVFALVIGLLIGLVVGALGAGGGILSIPALVFLLGQPPHEASVGSLIIVGTTSLISLIPRSMDNQVRWKEGITFGALSTVATFFGSRLSLLVSADLLMLALGILLAVVGIILFRSTFKNKKPADDSLKSKAKKSVLALIACASLTGLLTGFFGVGGGFVVVPMLILALGFNIRDASGTSLLVMVISSATGLISRIGADFTMEWPIIIAFALASMVGGLVGAPASRKVKENILTRIFALLLLGVSTGTLYSVLT